ncbi:MAG: DUF4276 family protein [Acidobacteria bacterium]|nr:DUF4276 family protein [Acidobacteriota bacterium]
MVNAHIYIEGADSKDDQILCRKAFRKLFERVGLSGRLPRTTACGSRTAAFDDFKKKLKLADGGDFIALLVDSEDPVTDVERTWAHLQSRDNWKRPAGASDEQVFLMTTCMETWIAADRASLRTHFGAKLQENALPALHELENRHRHVVQDALEHATRNCSNQYRKGKRSFEVLAELQTDALGALPSFARMARILKMKLGA